LPKRIENWSLTSLQQRLVKTGGRLVKHARYYWLLLAEGHLNRRRFGAMLGRIALLPLPDLLRQSLYSRFKTRVSILGPWHFLEATLDSEPIV